MSITSILPLAYRLLGLLFRALCRVPVRRDERAGTDNQPGPGAGEQPSGYQRGSGDATLMAPERARGARTAQD
jgi:hypothetical protein